MTNIPAQAYIYRSFVINNEQRAEIPKEAIRFDLKVMADRYLYRHPGGAIGWMSTHRGQRGINCADFVIKIRKSAGVADIKSGRSGQADLSVVRGYRRWG